MIIVAIAVIAGIVFILMLAAAFALYRLQFRLTSEVPPKSDDGSDSAAGPAPAPSPKGRWPARLKSSWDAMGVPIGVFLTAGLIGGLSFVLASVFGKFEASLIQGYFGIFRLEIFVVLIWICTALGGALGIRIRRLPWRGAVVAAVLHAAGLVAFASRTESSVLSSALSNHGLGSIPSIVPALFFVMVLASGVFLLPLFDPEVRNLGAAPSRWKVTLAAIFLFILVITFPTAENSWRSEVLRFTLLPGTLALIGLILSVTKFHNVGAWLGGLSVVLAILLLMLMFVSPVLIGMFSLHSTSLS